MHTYAVMQVVNNFALHLEGPRFKFQPEGSIRLHI